MENSYRIIKRLDTYVVQRLIPSTSYRSIFGRLKTTKEEWVFIDEYGTMIMGGRSPLPQIPKKFKELEDAKAFIKNLKNLEKDIKSGENIIYDVE